MGKKVTLIWAGEYIETYKREDTGHLAHYKIVQAVILLALLCVPYLGNFCIFDSVIFCYAYNISCSSIGVYDDMALMPVFRFYFYNWSLISNMCSIYESYTFYMVPRMTDMLCPLGAGGRGWLSSYNKENNAVDNVFRECKLPPHVDFAKERMGALYLLQKTKSLSPTQLFILSFLFQCQSGVPFLLRFWTCLFYVLIGMTYLSLDFTHARMEQDADVAFPFGRMYQSTLIISLSSSLTLYSL